MKRRLCTKGRQFLRRRHGKVKRRFEQRDDTGTTYVEHRLAAEEALLRAAEDAGSAESEEVCLSQFLQGKARVAWNAEWEAAGRVKEEGAYPDSYWRARLDAGVVRDAWSAWKEERSQG